MYFLKQQAIKAFILLFFSGFIFMLHHTGEIIKFINPQYAAFSKVASIIFLILFFIQVPRMVVSKDQAEDHDYCAILGCSHEIGSGKKIPLKNVVVYSIIILPLLTGMFLPYKDLGAAEAGKRGICYTPNGQHAHHPEDSPTSQLVLNQMTASPFLELHQENFAKYVNTILMYPEHFEGKSIQLEGFIMEDSSNDHVLLARFLVTHCVADAHVTGILLSSSDTDIRTEGKWVHVLGEIAIEEVNGENLPKIIVKEWKQIDTPKTPYIYP